MPKCSEIAASWAGEKLPAKSAGRRARKRFTGSLMAG